LKHLVLLALVYALILPGSLLAQESTETTTGTTPAATETAAAPAPAPAAAPEPAEPAPVAAPPEPHLLADEREEQPAEPEPQATAAASGSVTIVDFSFSPGTITINQGDTVTWVNDGPTPHSATASDGSFDTGVFPAGQSRSHTFSQAGTFAYICTPHPNMRGTVVVQASQSDGDTPTSDDTGGSGGTTGGTTGGASPGAEAAQADGGPALPNSGADAGALLVLGALMLLLGVAVHRRADPAAPRIGGRIGW
jgi:plastocyanin